MIAVDTEAAAHVYRAAEILNDAIAAAAAAGFETKVETNRLVCLGRPDLAVVSVNVAFLVQKTPGVHPGGPVFGGRGGPVG